MINSGHVLGVGTQWQLSLGVPYGAGASGLTLPKNVRNKLVVTALPSIEPFGFDPYMTPQGIATRFIGSGLGNGDSSKFVFDASLCIGVGVGSVGECLFEIVTRPYTETDFANTQLIPHLHAHRSFTNTSVGSVKFPTQTITLNDGDLIEIAITPLDNNFTDVAIPSGSIVIHPEC